jgi:hypothetical protein
MRFFSIPTYSFLSSKPVAPVPWLLLAENTSSLFTVPNRRVYTQNHTAAHKAHTAAHMLSLPLTPVQDATAAGAAAANAAAADASAAAAADASAAAANAAERTPFHGQAHNSRATFPPS